MLASFNINNYDCTNVESSDFVQFTNLPAPFGIGSINIVLIGSQIKIYLMMEQTIHSDANMDMVISEKIW